MAAKTAISEAEYLRTSFENPDREYRDGDLVERSMPTFRHGRTQANLCSTFDPRRSKFPLHPCVETRMRLRPGLYRIPDVAVFFGAESPDVPTPPLVAIEILSPDDRMADILRKLEEYRVWGVRHIWLVDPQKRQLFAYDGSLNAAQSLRLPELDFDLTPASIFG
jgi:Uma2 family endonuclease